MLTHWLWYSARTNMSSREKLRLLKRFSDAEDIFAASRERLAACPGVTPAALESLADKSLAKAEAALEKCAQGRVHILTWGDTNYPERLRQIADPPLLLYYRGILPDLNRTAAVGIVGTRKASAYGMGIAKQLGYQISRCGGIVVTGLAYGIDAMAAAGALQGNTPVVGVLGCGADQVYPRGNARLFDKMLETSCVISEYPPGTPPASWRFPQRNRLISGMCHGIVVVEAPEKSGAMITARCAGEQGRDIFTIPGNLDMANYGGNHILMREGAEIITSGWDVLSHYTGAYPNVLHPEEGITAVTERLAPEKTEKAQPAPKKSVDNPPISAYSGVSDLSKTERGLLELLGKEPQLIDSVIDRSGIPSGEALAALTTLELQGFTRTVNGNYIALS